MWRHVLAALSRRASVRYETPSIRRRLRGRGPQVWLSDCGYGALPVSKPLVVQIHEAGWSDPAIRATLDDYFVENILEGLVADAVRAAAHLITPSASARRQVVEHWSIPAERVHAVPHGVDTEIFAPRPGGERLIERAGGDASLPYVLFVSQIHPRKNLGVLRTAMEELAAAGFPHQLVVVGAPAQDRPDSSQLDAEARAELRGAPGRIVVLRDLTDEEVAMVMAQASVFCLPSLMEGFGLTALEAMSCGVPVIASDRGSLPEVVGDAGLVVEPTVSAVRDALARIIEDRDLAAELAERGRRRAADFTWERTADGWYDVLRLAARGR